MIQYVFPLFAFFFLLSVRAAVGTQVPTQASMNDVARHQDAAAFVAYHTAVENYVENVIHSGAAVQQGAIPNSALAIPSGQQIPPGAGNDIVSEPGGWGIYSWYVPPGGGVAGADPAFAGSAAFGYAMSGIYRTYYGGSASILPASTPQSGVIMSYVNMSGT